jgi:hypothetical protein
MGLAEMTVRHVLAPLTVEMVDVAVEVENEGKVLKVRGIFQGGSQMLH